MRFFRVDFRLGVESPTSHSIYLRAFELGGAMNAVSNMLAFNDIPWYITGAEVLNQYVRVPASQQRNLCPTR